MKAECQVSSITLNVSRTMSQPIWIMSGFEVLGNLWSSMRLKSDLKLTHWDAFMFFRDLSKPKETRGKPRKTCSHIVRSLAASTQQLLSGESIFYKVSCAVPRAAEGLHQTIGSWPALFIPHSFTRLWLRHSTHRGFNFPKLNFRWEILSKHLPLHPWISVVFGVTSYHL